MASLHQLLVVILATSGTLIGFANSQEFFEEVTMDATTDVFTTVGPTLSTEGIHLHCGNDSLTVKIPTNLLVEGVKGTDLIFKERGEGEEGCTGTPDDVGSDDVIVLNTDLDKCGTKRRETNGTEIYSNEVVNSDTKSSISRQYKVEIPVTCTYNRSNLVSDEWFKLSDYVLDTSLAETGKYAFDLEFYSDDEFKYPIDGWPYIIGLNEKLYFAASLGSPVYEDLSLSIKSCRATDHSESYQEEPHYDLIKDWESQEDETTLSCFNSSANNIDTVRVQTHAFRFLKLEGDQENVYIHCDLFVCDASDQDSQCADQCSHSDSANARQRRDVTLNKPALPIQRVTRGPIRLRRSASGIETQGGSNFNQAADQPMSGAMWGVILIAMGAVVIVLLAALVVTAQKLSKSKSSSSGHHACEEAAAGLLKNGESA